MSRVEQFLLGTAYSGVSIHVGLVNNMPDAVLRTTELQFAKLLKEAAGTLDVRLKLFSCRSIARGEETRARMAGFYDDARFLAAAGLDALIVTGPEPAAADLRQEPYWLELAQLIDWAQVGTLSTLFSGAAAHAAVLHLDGIAPRPLAQKLSGIYDSVRALDDPLLFNTAAAIAVPHARRHDLAESDLAARGYHVLSRLDFKDGARGQVDVFTRQPPNLSYFVFLQGHPEYDPERLGKDYLRDMGLYLRGESPEPPVMPQNYFDRATEGSLQAIAGQADLAGYAALVAHALPRWNWHANSVRLFANWLTLVAAAKARRASRNVQDRRRVS